MGSKRKRKAAAKDDEGDEEYEVEAICDSRVHKRQTEYLVKWKGYVECTWEQKRNLQCDELVAEYEAATKKKTTSTARAPKRARRAADTQSLEGEGEDAHAVDAVDAAESLPPSSADTAPANKSPQPTNERDSEKDETESKDADEYGYGFDDDYEDEPSVEAILEKRQIEDSVEYLVQRAGSSRRVWESADELDCEDLVQAFERNLKKTRDVPVVAPVSGVSRPHAQGKRKVAAAQLTHNELPSQAPGKKKARAGQPPLAAPHLPRQTRVGQPPPVAPQPARLVGLERAYLGRLVAYSPESDEWLKLRKNALYKGVGAAYITGRVSDYKYTKKTGLYEIRSIDSMFQSQVEKVPVSVIKQGCLNQEKLESQTNVPRWMQLCRPDATEAVDIGEDIEELVECEPFTVNQMASVSLADVEKIKSLSFEPNGQMRAPTALYAHEDGTITTRVKAEYVGVFEHSASSSFFAYLPVYFWRQVLLHTNEQAKANKVAVPFTLDELMKFFGIMWYMALVDKGEYANYWGEQVEDTIFATTRSNLDGIMPLRRFKQLRSAFCFRNAQTITPDELKLDAAVRIRTLLNMLKQTGSKYVDVGRNLAVDEASVASRSKFARHLIVYNPRKPTGKYHFKLYMTCCATSWIALSYRLHCASTIEERASGVHEGVDTAMLADEMNTTSATRQIVLEITREFHGSGRIVNCDNFYTSVQLLEALRLKRLFCRGTVKQTSKHFPRHVVLPDPNKQDKNANKSKQKRTATNEDEDSDRDAEVDEGLDAPLDEGDGHVPRAGGEVKRGDYLQAVCHETKMLGASWCDGNIVTIISNADNSSISSVERLIKGKKTPVPAPTAIKEYNQHMQGVDRNDQVRARFSVADGHSFKKWHKKLAFAIIDIARVNAFLTRRLCMGDTGIERDSHRAFVVDLITEMLHGKWQDAPCDEVMLYDGTVPPRSPGTPSQRSAVSPSTRSPRLEAPTDAADACSDMSSAQVFKGKRRKRICIVCHFEGRADTTVTMACLKHNVALCKRTYVDPNRQFGCLQNDWSCWVKYHEYYLAQGTFSDSGCVLRSSKDYKEKYAMIGHTAITSQMLAQRTLAYDTAPAPQRPIAPSEESNVDSVESGPPSAPITPAAPMQSSAPGTPFAPSTPGSWLSDAASHDYS